MHLLFLCFGLIPWLTPLAELSWGMRKGSKMTPSAVGHLALRVLLWKQTNKLMSTTNVCKSSTSTVRYLRLALLTTWNHSMFLVFVLLQLNFCTVAFLECGRASPELEDRCTILREQWHWLSCNKLVAFFSKMTLLRIVSGFLLDYTGACPDETLCV